MGGGGGGGEGEEEKKKKKKLQTKTRNNWKVYLALLPAILCCVSNTLLGCKPFFPFESPQKTSKMFSLTSVTVLAAK